MNKFLVFFLIIILVLSGVIVYFYYTEEIPQQNEVPQITNFNIETFDITKNKNIKTGYEIYINNMFYTEGSTDENGFVLNVLPINSTVLIKNKNLVGQKYFIVHQNFDTFNKDINTNTRVNFKLFEMSNINISKDGSFINGSYTTIFLKDGIGNISDLYVCFKYSSKIIYVRLVNNTDFSNTDKINRYSKCFLSNRELNIVDYNFTIETKYFGELKDDDYLFLYLVNKEDLNSTIEYDLK